MGGWTRVIEHRRNATDPPHELALAVKKWIDPVGEITLQNGQKGEPQMSNDFRTGGPVPENGFYRVRHSQHRLPKEVTLLIGQAFPRCSKCAEPVYFDLIRCALSLGMMSRFKVALYELPELPEENESLAS